LPADAERAIPSASRWLPADARTPRRVTGAAQGYERATHTGKNDRLLRVCEIIFPHYSGLKTKRKA